jgi:hypothetical protein
MFSTLSFGLKDTCIEIFSFSRLSIFRKYLVLIIHIDCLRNWLEKALVKHKEGMQTRLYNAFKESMSVPKAVNKTILGPGDIEAIFEPELN